MSVTQSISVKSIDLNVLNMRTRMPFRYGIAELLALPHLMVRATCNIDGQESVGLAADGLPPKWFTKNPASEVAADLQEMIDVIKQAVDEAPRIAPQPTVFGWWRKLFDIQGDWGLSQKLPALLWNFGVSLIERAVIDAFCRAKNVTFANALRQNTFGVRLGEIYPQLAGKSPAQFLTRPLRKITLRHTVGLGDPLTDADILAGERLDDGLPQSLETNIRAYGLTHFKIKLSGDVGKDQPRLRALSQLLEATGLKEYAFTLDGNEQFKELASFRSIWDSLTGDPALKDFFSHLIFVEQALHRDVALSDETREAMLGWAVRPATIIDESDGDLTSLGRALDCGYVGTSHKNCKGVFKGLANACYLSHLRLANKNQRYEMSGEDLANVGPIAMLQDITAAAAFGLSHVERNGHHYFAGLSMWPKDVQEQTMASHSDLYRLHERGFPTLKIEGGKINVGSCVDAPFGVKPLVDSREFTALKDWSMGTL